MKAALCVVLCCVVLCGGFSTSSLQDDRHVALPDPPHQQEHGWRASRLETQCQAVRRLNGNPSLLFGRGALGDSVPDPGQRLLKGVGEGGSAVKRCRHD